MGEEGVVGGVGGLSLETLCPDLDEFISVLSSGGGRGKTKKTHHIWTEEEAGSGTSGQSNHLFLFLHTTNNNLLVQRHPGVST